MTLPAALFLFVAWVGHGYLWTGILNHLYAKSLPKKLLKPFRVFVGVIIVAYPVFIGLCEWRYGDFEIWPDDGPTPAQHDVVVFVTCLLYLLACFFAGVVVVPLVTLYRNFRPKPNALLAETTDTLHLWERLGPSAVGDGKLRWMTTLPGTDCFTVELTHQTLAVPDLPPPLAGLTLLVVSDLHWHGTPGRAWWDAVFDHLAALPPADLVVMAGDVVDTDRHHEWIRPLLGRLDGGHKLAVLGNHDAKHHPQRLRAELEAAGYTVLGNAWTELTIRGVPVVAVGHEGPWFRPGPDLTAAPAGFRLCVSHSPDNWPWAVRHGCRLTVCGHVHGGQVRLPVATSIFVPSAYGRRFDQGVHERPGGVLAVCRGLAGNEPIRFRCRPQVLRVTLAAG